MITLSNVTHQYKDGKNAVTVLDHFNLQISDGKFVVVIGPSGSGKSTLLHILGGLMPPTEGQVVIDGKDYYGLNPASQTDFRSENIGYVFQDIYLIEDFTLIDNILLSMQNSKDSRKEKRTKAVKLMEMLGLGERISWKIKNLSGGERQRVAIARALANDRKLILCDEPTGSLDEKSAREIMSILRKVQGEGRTVVVVTHNTQFAQLADQVIDLSGEAVHEVTE